MSQEYEETQLLSYACTAGVRKRKGMRTWERHARSIPVNVLTPLTAGINVLYLSDKLRLSFPKITPPDSPAWKTVYQP
jgi:hypothetical protein